jgi:hypothetical protein
LFPFFSPPGTTLVAACFALPFLVGFLRDWLAVSGVFQEHSNATGSVSDAVIRFLTTWGALILRLTVAFTLLWILVRLPGSNPAIRSLTLSITTMMIFGLMGVILMAVGAAGRVAALAVLFSLGILQSFAPLGNVEILLIIGASAVFFLGSGIYSIWTPEKLLISKRIGEG